jgi:hypothetical protein
MWGSQQNETSLLLPFCYPSRVLMPGRGKGLASLHHFRWVYEKVVNGRPNFVPTSWTRRALGLQVNGPGRDCRTAGDIPSSQT